MNKLLIFPSPLDALCTLVHDTGGWTLTGTPDTAADGRPGQSFIIPPTTFDQNGARLTITAPKKVPLTLRGILYVSPQSSFRVDDFPLVDANVTLPRLVLDGHTLKQDV